MVRNGAHVAPECCSRWGRNGAHNEPEWVLTMGRNTQSVIFIMFADKDDRPAGVFMRIFIAFPSIVIATAAAIFERILQNAVDIKSENDLTV